MRKVLKTERFEKFEDTIIIVTDMTSFYEEVVRKAIQVRIICMPNMMVEADYVETAEPIQFETRFIINNEDNQLNTNIYNQQKLVFRRENEALKLFNVQNMVDNKVMDTNLLVEAKNVYGWLDKENGGKRCRVHTFMMDEEPKIKGWHLLEKDEFFRLESPDRVNLLDFRFTETGFEVRRNGKTKSWIL